MAFSMPRNVPNFSDPNRQLEDKVWGYGKQSSLPMYKDKPYGYGPSGGQSIWRKKRVIGGFVIGGLFVLYVLGFFSDNQQFETSTKRSWFDLAREDKQIDWDRRREHVVEAFQLSWDAYERYGWGFDEYHPIAKTGKNMAEGGMGWIIIDSLDTMILMNQTTRLEKAREWITKSLSWEKNQDVSTFETTIRMLGGLLSAHYLSTEYPNLAPLTDDDEGARGEDLYLEKAKDLADRLLAAFDTPSGVPYASVNLEKYKGIPSTADLGASSTAEVTTLQLEFKYLAKLTGEVEYWERVEKVMEIVDSNQAKDGLLPIFIYATNGEFRGNIIRLGSRGDSYYEYLLKQYLQTNKQEPIYEDMWNEAVRGIRKHLVTYTKNSQFTIVGEKPYGIDGDLSPKMDHLVCFLPGTLALGATGGLTEAEARKLPSWSQRNEDDMQLAKELMHTCWATYKVMATGLAAEITYFEINDPPTPASAPHQAPEHLDTDPHAAWRKDFDVHSQDTHNLQRPETVESLFYMWRITGDVKYREWGWEMFESFVNHTAVADQGGFTSLRNADVIPAKVKDNMESFWLAETLKYMYLLFSPNDLMSLDKIVINTEGHPFPRFDMGKLFSTGWQREPRVPKAETTDAKEAEAGSDQKA